MDSKVPSQKVTQELARELLIAISYSVPDTDPNSNSASKIVDGTNGAVAANVDEVEKYRSELISISDDQSPDAQVPPVVLENHCCVILHVMLFCFVFDSLHTNVSKGIYFCRDYVVFKTRNSEYDIRLGYRTFATVSFRL
ncbi:hypothetical protein V6N13_060425 [Hibiscus sabdariffa]